MNTFPILNPDPIREAVIQFRFLPKFNDIDAIREYGELIKPKYLNQKPLEQKEINFQIGGNAPNPKVRDLETLLACQSEDLKQTVTIASDRVTLTLKDDYPGWESFSNEAIDLWMKLQQIVSCKYIGRLGVRFINFLELPKDKGVDFDDYLEHGPQIPSEAPQTLSSFINHTVLVNKEIDCHANHIQLYQPSPDQEIGIVIDIDVFTVKKLDVGVEIIKEKLNQIRNYKNTLFFGSITKSVVESFRG